MSKKLLLITPLLLLLTSCVTEQQTAVHTNATATPAATASPVPTPCDFTQVPVAERGNCAWQLFVQLNSPTTGTSPTNWEQSYRPTETVYLPNGCPPPPWGQTPPPPAAVLEQAKSLPKFVQGSQVWHYLNPVNKFQVNGLVLKDKWNQAVLYQLLMNQSTFDYIVQRGFYNVEGQEQAATENKPADFPANAFELKTSWIWIGTDQAKFDALNGKYYIVQAYYENVVNGQPQGIVTGYAALSGMHIINKQQPDWVWMTFENVNNPTFTQAKLELPIPDYAVQSNKTYQQQLQAQGSVFANYQLDGVQMSFNDPTLLANSNIESAFQKESSCMTCHSLASIQANGAYFNLVNNQGGNVGYYTGNPPDRSAFTLLDFVWSMRRASRRGNNVCTQGQ